MSTPLFSSRFRALQVHPQSSRISVSKPPIALCQAPMMHASRIWSFGDLLLALLSLPLATFTPDHLLRHFRSHAEVGGRLAAVGSPPAPGPAAPVQPRLLWPTPAELGRTGSDGGSNPNAVGVAAPQLLLRVGSSGAGGGGGQEAAAAVSEVPPAAAAAADVPEKQGARLLTASHLASSMCMQSLAPLLDNSPQTDTSD